ncbi:hypothetical protein N7533_003042 [Penicillium manginii]|uniref:uncharacterized protein n=1 Tax=Penicillium manginii TaxID=203109 RepID=UPI0025467372|nr:uncharacterized protein N7533_003042 [Penicillium manginii]KAJ5764361.1 hypothetical protein N7533_003042 [Penicillium manginii]
MGEANIPLSAARRGRARIAPKRTKLDDGALQGTHGVTAKASNCQIIQPQPTAHPGYARLPNNQLKDWIGQNLEQTMLAVSLSRHVQPIRFPLPPFCMLKHQIDNW